MRHLSWMLFLLVLGSTASRASFDDGGPNRFMRENYNMIHDGRMEKAMAAGQANMRATEKPK